MQKLRESRLQLIVKFFLRADATIFLLVLDLLLSFSQLRASWDIFQAHVFLKSQSLNMIGPKSE